jgi:putative toxin-antitoxin system antitoxin component (TIGR02293 family)
MPLAKDKTVRFRHKALPKTPAGTGLLGIDTPDAVQLVRLIRIGFPYSRLARFQKATQLPLERIARFVGIPQRTLTRRASEGKLHPDESDRLLRASRVFELAVDLFEGDLPAARQWLETPQPALAGQVPLEFAATDVGAREVENLIGRLEHGIVA